MKMNPWSKRLLALTGMLVLLVSLAVLTGCKKKQEADGRPELYWNVEKAAYSSGELTRAPQGDYYQIRFAKDGKQMDIPVASYETVQFIDTMEVMGLEMNEEGVVTKALRVEEMGCKIVAEDYYVQSFDDMTIVCNQTGTGKGYTKTLTLNEDTGIYFVDEKGGPLSGSVGNLGIRSKILAIANAKGEVTHVFTEDPFKEQDIYWNIKRMYDSNLKMTTRTPDVIGTYTFEFAVNGEQVTLQTRDAKVANSIDAIAAKCMGLTFDENGYISGVVATKIATGNSSFASWYHVLDIDGQIVSTHKYSSGNDARGTMAADCKVYDVSGKGDYVGQPTTLRLYDQIHGLKNPYGEISIIFVVGRSEVSNIYWNVDRQWDSVNKQTKRTPNRDGYYEFLLAVDGEQKTFRTKDKAVADTMDSIAVKCFGLKEDAGVIEKAYPASYVWGGRQFCSWDIVTDITDGVVTAVETTAGKEGTYVGAMAKDCKVFNVSTTAVTVGEKTNLRVGDKIHALKNFSGEITYAFVVDRTVTADIYWNVERKWDSRREQSTRQPDQDGYYRFVLSVDGQQKTLRTRNKQIVKDIDGTATRCFGLYVSGDVITKCIPTAKVYGGTQFCSWDFVTEIDGKKIVAEEATAGKEGTYRGTMKDSCGVYNVSAAAGVVGEKTTLRVGDKIHALMDKGGKITHIFVVDRAEQIYWNVDRMWDSDTGKSTRKADSEGYYKFTLVKNGALVTLRTKDAALVEKIDSIAVRCFGLATDGDVITRVMETAQLLNGRQFCSWDIVTELDGNKIVAEEATAGKEGTYTGTLAADCGIFDVSPTAKTYGASTKLKVGDKIHALKNGDGTVGTIFVVEHNVTAKIYWNVSRQWDDEQKTTKREPDAGGYYSIVLAADGEQKTFRTKNKNIINAIDSTVTKCVGLETSADGDILWCYSTSVLANGKQFCSYDDIISIDGRKIVAAEAEEGKQLDKNGNAVTYTGVMTADCGIYNVSNTATVVGEATTLHTGDKIHALKDRNGNITTVYVVGHVAPVYWNVDRKWSANTGKTTRVPDAEGYYSIVLAVDGEQKTLRTNDVEIVNAIDGTATKCFGLEVSGDIIEEFFITSYLSNAVQFCSYDIVTELDGKKIVAKETTAGAEDVFYTGVLAENCNVYDVSTFAGTVGERTTLQVGDKIHALKNYGGKVGTVYVVERRAPVHEKTAHCDVCDADVTWYSWDGVAEFENGKHYFLEQDRKLGKSFYIGTSTDSSMQVTLDLCGKTLSTAQGFADRMLYIYGELNLLDSGDTGVITTSVDGKQAPVFYLYRNGVFNMYGGTLTSTVKSTHKDGGGIGVIGSEGITATMNLYGGTITGGQSAGNGGNILLYKAGVLNMYGGTITGGASDKLGGGVYLPANAKLNVSGTAQITGNTGSNVYLPAGAKIGAGALETGAKIGFTMASPGVFATASNAAEIAGFFENDGEETILVSGNDLMLEVPHVHCVCGAADVSHGTCADVSWEAWPGEDNLVMDGTHYYYLTGDVSLSDTITVEAGKTLNLCLNGHTITDSDRVFSVYGTLNLTDCAETQGTVKGTKSSGQAPVFYVYKNGTFNLFGGKLTANKSTSTSGGGIGVIGSGGITATMNLYGGTITGGRSAGNGGNILLYKAGVLNMFGGNITGGSSDKLGGGVYLPSTAFLNVYGKAQIAGNTGSNVYLPDGAKITAGELADGAKIGVTMKTPGTFLTSTGAADLEGFFISDDANYVVKAAGSDLLLELGPHTHCLCNGDAENVGTHACEEKLWEAWPGADNLVMDGTHYYYLTEDVQLAETITVNAGSTLNLCLNGHNLENTGGKRLLQVIGVCNLTDCADTHGTVSSTNTGSSPVFYIKEGAEFNLFGGKLTKGADKNTNGGVGGIEGGSTKGTLNMYGGAITGGKVTGNGGNIIMYKNAILNLYGGTISDGTTTAASGNGGNVSANNAAAKVNIYGGVITGGSAKMGKDLYMKGSTLVVSGAPTIGDVYLPSGVSAAVGAGGLVAGAKIGITMASPGAFLTDDNASELAQYFESSDESYQVAASGNKLELKANG